MVPFTEPFALITYVFRAFRLRKIFDAQQVYYKERKKPTALLAQIRESRLIMLSLVTVAILTGLFLVPILALGTSDHLFKVPSYDPSSFFHLSFGRPDITQAILPTIMPNFN